MTVSLQEAQRIIDAGVAKAQDMGVSMAVAVVDANANLVAVARMDGMRAFGPDIARGKAMAAAVWGQPSADLQERAKTSSVFEPVNRLYGGQLVYGRGAVPLLRGGEMIGAVGASGARPEQDEEVAMTGAATLDAGS